MSNRFAAGPDALGLRERAHALGVFVDDFLNRGRAPKPTGFVLMVFPLDDPDAPCNYVSNTDREDVAELFKEHLMRFEAQPDAESNP